MRTSKEERADLRARCRAGVIAITTDAALVEALIDELEAEAAKADRLTRERDKFAGLIHSDMLTSERAYCPTCELWYAAVDPDSMCGHETCPACRARVATERAEKAERERDAARAERDARPEITAEAAAVFIRVVCADRLVASLDEYTKAADVAEVLRAHARKVAR